MANDGIEPSRVAGLNNTWPGRGSPTWTGIPSQISDTVLDAGWSERADGPPRLSPWRGQRLMLLVLLALLGCLAVAGLVRALSASARIDAHWRSDPQGRIELASSADLALQPHIGQALTGIIGADDSVVLVDALALQRAPRWVIDDAGRTRQ